MSILETFYILFKGDNSDVKKKADETKVVTQNLQEALTGTFRKIDTSTATTGRSFFALAKAALTFVSASTAAYAVLNKTIAASNYAAELGNVSRVLRVNAGDLDAWGQAVQRVGGSAAGFQQSLKSLSHHFGANAQVSLKILPQLADVFKRLGNYRAQYYGRMLGLDESTILLLQQGRREVEGIINRQKELGVVTQKDIEIATKYKIANLELSLAFRSLYLTIGQTIIPVLTAAYRALVPFVEYLKQHKDLVIGAFIGIGVAAGIMLLPFIVANAAILAVGAAIATVIGLFAIAYEDIRRYLKGQESLTGDLIKRWSNVKNVLHDAFIGLGKVIEIAFFPLYKAIKAVEYLLSLFGKDNKLTIDIANGQSLIDAISNSALLTPNPAGFLSQSFNRNASVNTGDVIINTQANDAPGIAKSFREELTKHFWHTNNQIADGVAY